MAKAERLPGSFWLALAGWAVPGLAHVLIGRRGKAALFFFLVLGTFVAGMTLAGFDNVYWVQGRWTALTQYPGGMVALIGAALRETVEPAVEERTLFKIGTVYTSVAGLLNVLVVMDAVYSAQRRRCGEATT